MDTRKIPVFCYWSGCIKDGPDGPFYEGSIPRVIRVESKIQLPKLLDDLHHVTGFEKGKFQIELVGRYPSSVQQSMVKYMRLPIVDDSSLVTMLEVPSYHPSINSVEFYLEVKPVSLPVSHWSPLVNNGSFSGKRGRQKEANINAGVNRDNMLRNLQEDNNNGWIEDEESPDARNCGNGGKNEDAKKDLNMKKAGPSPTEGSDSKQLIFSSSWLDESELYVGMRFRDKDELKKAVELYAARRQREYHELSFFSSNLHFQCRGGCRWSLSAAETKGNGFEITKYEGPHTCEPENVGSDFLAGEIECLVRAQPSLSIAELNKWVKEEFGYVVSHDIMWDAKTKAITSILGNFHKSFDLLPKLMAALCSSNKMVLDWEYDVFPHLKDASFCSVFWAFQQSIEGFPHCRPLVMVDTIYLSGKYPGTVLVAGGLDAENRLFPLAFAIITQESLSADSWRWFFSCIRKKVTQRQGLCLITSPNPDIVAVVNEPEYQWAQHRFSLKHLCLKFYDVFHNNLMTEFVFKAGSSMEISSFDYYLKKIEKLNPEAWKWLNKMPPQQWALSHDDGGLRFGIMDTNLVFATYGFLNKVRDLPITTCILLIFDHLTELFESQRGLLIESVISGDKYAKHVMKNLEEYKVASTTHDVLPLDQTGHKFQVMEVRQVGKKKLFVHRSDRVCTCGIWQVYKYPCSHVLAVCRRLNIDYLQYVDDSYNTESCLRVYAADFNPLPRVSDWPEASQVPRLFLRDR